MSRKIENEKSMKKFYDTIADKYDYIFPLSPMQKKFLDEEVKGKKILDVGAGTGKVTKYLSEKGMDLTSIDLNERLIKKASEKGVVTPANYNTPAQIVIGGEVEAVDYAVELLKEAGAKRLIPLNVSGPFHTALLESASQKLAAELEKVSFKDFTLPLVGNTEAQIMKSEDVKALLARQVMEPVRFYDSIATIQEFGVDEVIEIGPGKVLSGFLKKIDKTLPTYNVEDQASLDALLNA